MKDYFIGQGTWIAAQFDTLEEMLAYDCRAHKCAHGWAVTWSWYDKSDPWRDWT